MNKPKPLTDDQIGLMKSLDLLPDLIKHSLPHIQAGSSLMADQEATIDLLDLPQLCDHYIGASADYLRGLFHLTRPAPRLLQVPRFSAYPLIRSSIENSGQAIWILGAQDQQLRFRRMLQIQKSEMDFDQKYVDASTKLSDADVGAVRSRFNAIWREVGSKKKNRWKRLVAAGEMVGVNKSEFERGFPGFEPLLREAADEQKLTGRYVAGVWLYISGLTHPSFFRAWSASVHKKQGDGPDGTINVWSEADPTILGDTVRVAIKLHIEALKLRKAANATTSD